MRHSMAKMNYNRPIHRQTDDRRKETLQIAKKELGKTPVIMSNVIRFGKYKNWHLKDIPSDYLEWIISVTPDDSVAMKYARELANRPEYVKKLNNRKEMK